VSTARLFFALWPDSATRRALRKSCRDAVAFCGGRPVSPKHYHLTLAFLGNVPVERLPAIRRAAAVVPMPALSIDMDCFGYFPGARVLWIGPTEVPAELARLAGALWQALAPLDLRPEHRAFRPHLTIARKIARGPAGHQPRPLTWRAQAFALVRSVTAPGGARYTVDQYFPKGSSTEP
jgi:2'-5' RNA ligase